VENGNYIETHMALLVCIIHNVYFSISAIKQYPKYTHSDTVKFATGYHRYLNLSYQPTRKRDKSHIRHICKRLLIREGVVKRYLGE